MSLQARDVGDGASSKKLFYVLLLLLLLIGLILHLRSTEYPFLPVDDAYTTLHNAQVMRAGEDRNFGTTPPLSGATSAPHLLLVAGLLNFFPSAWASFAAAWIGVVLYALALAHLAFVHRASPAQAALIVMVGLGVGLTLHQLFNGLETGLAMAGLTWALALASTAEKSGSRWPRLVLYGQLPFLRPELAAAASLFLLLEGSHHWRRTASVERTVKAMGVDVGVVLLAAAPWLLWYQASLGVPVPASVEAKRLYFAEGCLPARIKIDWVLLSLAAFARTMGLLVVGFALLFRSRPGWVGVAFMVVFFLAYYTLFPGALGHYEQRYVYVLVPVLLFGFVSLLADSNRFLRHGVTVMLVLLAAQSISNGAAAWNQNKLNARFTEAELEGMAAWSRNHLPRDAVLLVHDVGYISHATDFRLVDFVGLKTPSSVHFHRTMTWPSCGEHRGQAVHQIALLGRPGYLVMLQGWDRIYRITDSLRSQGWRVDEVRSPHETHAYRIYRLGLPDPR